MNSPSPQRNNFGKLSTTIGVVHVFVEVFKEFLQILILRDVVNFFQFFPKPSISLATVKEATSCIKFLAPSAIPCDAISSGRRHRAYKPAADTGDPADLPARLINPENRTVRPLGIDEKAPGQTKQKHHQAQTKQQLSHFIVPPAGC